MVCPDLPCPGISVSICLFQTVSLEGREYLFFVPFVSFPYLSASHVSLVPCLPVCPIFSLSSTFPFVWPFLVAPSLPPHRQPLNQSGRLALCWIHEEDPPGLGTLELQGWSPPAPGHVPPPGSAASSAASGSLTARPRADPQGPVPKSSLPSVTFCDSLGVDPGIGEELPGRLMEQSELEFRARTNPLALQDIEDWQSGGAPNQGQHL